METKTWKLYHRDREYARQCGDPVLQEVLAETRFDAEQRWNGLSPVGVIAVEATGSGLEPLELAKTMVLAGTEKGDSVLDPFFGTGTVLRACIELGRKFDGIDIDPDSIRYIQELG